MSEGEKWTNERWNAFYDRGSRLRRLAEEIYLQGLGQAMIRPLDPSNSALRQRLARAAFGAAEDFLEAEAAHFSNERARPEDRKMGGGEGR